MSNLIERIARAMCATSAHDPDELVDDIFLGGEDKIPRWRLFADAARAVINILAAGDALGRGLIVAPTEANPAMLKAVHACIPAYLHKLPADHPWRAKGWLQGAKMAAEAKAAIRYSAMMFALTSTTATKAPQPVAETT